MMVSMAKAVLLEILNKTNFIKSQKTWKKWMLTLQKLNDFVSLLINKKIILGNNKNQDS